jgi:Asp-tRNA(Asn)/Glu-tRNA(Gln) amidotransferase A subunit family amidase
MLPTIESLAAELAAGRTSSVELTRAALARAADPAGEGARVFTRVDADRAWRWRMPPMRCARPVPCVHRWMACRCR